MMKLLTMDCLNFELWQWLILFLIMLPAVISDIRRQSVHMIPVLFGTAVGIVASFFVDGCGFSNILYGLLIGAFLLFAAALLKGNIGIGDGFVCMFVGSVIGWKLTLMSILFAFIGAAIICLVLLMLRKVSRHTRIPLVPFIASGVLCVGLM